ncbi:immunoglobulin E-set [Mycena albidolilacea]|uniref:Immunoglobulin E-set n=1 Tax=Mycena albidolilacea TaxID=1033008 RepID=A0AAD7EU95_9AGAR|nr:immunoglobulin E-set [Mycena albidolilacea]
MSHADEDSGDFAPSASTGYKLTLDQYAQLPAEDESLARWKASLGIAPSGPTTGPKVTVETLELRSTPMPGKKIVLDLTNETKNNPIIIKEGVNYNFRITFKVNHSIVSGLRHIQRVKRAGINVDHSEQRLDSDSYHPHPTGEAYVKDFPEEASPSGIFARSGTYAVRSSIVDDDGEIHAEWDWGYKLAKEW